MDRDSAARWPTLGLALAIAAVPVAVAVALRTLPPMMPAADGSWVPAVFALLLAGVAGAATIVLLVPALRDGSLGPLLQAGSSATLAGGSVALLAGGDSLAAPMLVAAALGAVATTVDDRRVPDGTPARIGAATAVLAVAEAVALLGVLPGPAAVIAASSTPMLAAAALVALWAAWRSRGTAAAGWALLAAGAVGLGLDRGGTLEGVVGIAVVACAQLLGMAAAWDGAPAADPIEERLPELASRLTDAVVRFDGHLRLREWNATAAGLLGLEAGSVGTRMDDLLGVALSGLPPEGGTAVSHRGVGGLEIAIHRSGDGVVAVIRDPGAAPEAERLGMELRTTIEELLRARRTIDLQRGELERSSTVDQLTGVASRSAILERLRIEVAQARRYRHPLAVVLLDVDRFGEINAEHGIEVGDSVLREVALRIRLRVREADALGRCGSDGFLATLPHTDEAGAATFADALRHRIGQRPLRVGEAEIAVTVSIGVATMRPGEELDLDGLLARVQEALDSARGTGGDRIALDRLHGLARLEDRHPPGNELEEPDAG